MKTNTAGQAIGAQMVSAADGSAFTGAVTVYVTGDAGTQAVGSVGSGACVHEGNGYQTYAPAQAETNYALIAFTFIGTGAVPATLQIYTSFPQTGDSFGRIGVAGAGLTALGDARVANLDAAVSSRMATYAQPTGFLAAAFPAAPAAVGDIPTAIQNADALLNRDMSTGTDSGSATVRTVRQALRFLRNKWTLAGTTLSVKKEDDITDSWTGIVTTTAGADPITGSDPA